MISNEQAMDAMMCSYEKYAALRAELGFPLPSKVNNTLLPSWVLRVGDKPKTDWVMPKRAAAQHTDAVITDNTPAVTVAVAVQQPAAPKAESWAARVRAVIVAAKARGETQQQVLKHAVEVLGMKDSSARNCIKFNWDRV
jgi:hypothetical protein